MKNIATPKETFKLIQEKMGPYGRTAFLATFIIGLLTHLSIMVSDIPNHDGLDSIYFDQNMIGSGRWFLTVACGISSYFSLPWLIGILAIFYISMTSVVLVSLLRIKDKPLIVAMSGILVTFPAIASNFAYAFTMDGYMLGMFLCVLSVWLATRYKWGFILGAISLGFGMGIYQSYLCTAMLLCIYMTGMILMEKGKAKDKVISILKLALTGVIGLGFYAIMLNILMRVQNVTLSDYQGINDMSQTSSLGLVGMIKHVYSDFIRFTLNSRVFIPNKIALVAMALLGMAAAISFIRLMVARKWYKNPLFYIFTIGLISVVPIAVNAILIISSDVTYHLIMRYTWCYILIIAIGLISYSEGILAIIEKKDKKNISSMVLWGALIGAGVIAFTYAVTDNIAYSNMQKKYEKTYAYCVRLADRIEQTDGYYQGIPIAMVGVVGDQNFPSTDVTMGVTDNIIGASGDFLLYKGENYQLFFRHYLGTTYNILSDDHVIEFYDTEEYQALTSFPEAGSTKVIDGVLYVKTENQIKE